MLLPLSGEDVRRHGGEVLRKADQLPVKAGAEAVAAGEQADRVGEVHLRPQQGEAEQRDHVHHGGHHGGEAQADGVDLILFHGIHSL